MQTPKKWKMALLVWMAIFPTISIISIALGDWLAQLHLLLRTFMMSIILVPFMIFFAMPKITKHFQKWLIK
jgi:antibiotic biosynthesis monooxygenase (ABM) superfamily enzyme